MEEQSFNAAPVSKSKMPLGLIVLLLVMILLGVVTGGLISGKSLFRKGEVKGVIPESEIAKGKEFGSRDAASFKDTATGVVEAGGISGEGTHKLLREGGPSQTVYLTSSVLDLDQFIGKKIQAWGETFKAQKAGWLMDVGKIKILE